MSQDSFALPEENKPVVQSETPYIEESFPQVDPNQVEAELIDQFKDMQENMPPQDVATHFFKMYFPIYKQLLGALSNKDLRRVAEHVIQWPLEDENPKFHDEKAKQAFAVGIRLRDCWMIMKSWFEMERHKEIQAQQLKAEQEAVAQTAETQTTEGNKLTVEDLISSQTQGEDNGEQV